MQSINNKPSLKLPYFDFLLAQFKEGNKEIEKSFGRHVHWGYWEHPLKATLTSDDFAAATEELSKQVCKSAKIQNNLHVLDVGCGFGGTIAYINENFQHMRLLGINIDERQLERARDIVKPLEHNQIDFKRANACALPVPDQSIDVILAVECIFHFPDREQFFKEAFRVLKPGGYLALSDFLPKPAFTALFKLKALGIFDVGFYGRCNFLFTQKDYLDLAYKTGFKVTNEHNITSNTLPTYTYIRQLSNILTIKDFFALFETACAEIFSRLKVLEYFIYGFHKPV